MDDVTRSLYAVFAVFLLLHVCWTSWLSLSAILTSLD